MLEHIPVMMSEVMDGLNIRPGGTYWDGTFGRGGHSRSILDALQGSGGLISSDRDGDAEAVAKNMVGREGFQFIRGPISAVVDQVPDGLAGFLLDLGCATPQLKDAQRGFSFSENGPLDMRMDLGQTKTAAHLVNQMEETELANLIYQYGEERLSRRIARTIVTRRKSEPINDTQTLAAICAGCYPRRYHRIHPATRTFQALRIAVNDELGELEQSLPKALDKLGPHGRGVVISFHSLEDRIVKHGFKNLAKEGGFAIITKRPLRPTEEETAANPASRSAKLRIIEKRQGGKT